MADGSTIEWTDATWNPIVGCSVISPGCQRCYAMKLAGGRLRNHKSRRGLTTDSKAGAVWTGEVRLIKEWLDQPLHWKRPRRIFVCAHGDLFHENVSDAWIDQVFAVMALSPQHTFQVLTKRATRMRAWFEERWQPAPAQRYVFSKDVYDVPAQAEGEDRFEQVFQACEEVFERNPGMDDPKNDALWNAEGSLKCRDFAWPLPNVWLGVSAEDQRRADERIPELLAAPAAKRFLSAEPLLGPLLLPRGLDWVIAGGESGIGARPSHPDWFRSLRAQCVAAEVPFFFKQWGEYAPDPNQDAPSGEYVARWPDEIVRTCADTTWMGRVGKKAAGALLDGVEHRAFPT